MSATGGRAVDRTTGGHVPDRDRPVGQPSHGFLERLSRGLAMAGGILLVGVMGMTVASILGRYVFGTPIPGDYELTELACGIAVFAFLPYCHAASANIVVEFMTSRLPRRTRAALDCVHGLAFTVMAGLITWRLFVGAMRKLEDGETTLYLEIPVHGAYFLALISAGLLTAVCFVVVRRHLQALRR